MRQATKEVSVNKDCFTYFDSNIKGVNTKVVEDASEKLSGSYMVQGSKLNPTDAPTVKTHVWYSREVHERPSQTSRKAREPINKITGTLLKIEDHGIVCEFDISGKTKILELQKSLFKEAIQIGDIVQLSMDKSDGFLKPLISTSKPSLLNQTDESDIASTILESF